jgi:ABC-type transporter Mla subunit MlaD
MSAKSNDFKIGIFVLIGLAILLAAIVLFGAEKILERKILEETYIAGDVGGLKVGAPVNLRGVPVGQVTRIDFTWNIYHVNEPRFVYIEFEVRRNVSFASDGKGFAQQMREEVASGLRARVKSQGLVGASEVSLEYLNPKQYPPLKIPWRPKHIYIPSAPGPFSEMLASLNTTVNHLKALDLESLAHSVQGDLAAAERLIDHLDETNFRQIGTNANALLTELREASTQLRTFIGETNAPQRVHNLAELSDRTDQVLLELKASLARLDRMLANFNTASLNQTLDNLQRASQQVEEAAREFKQYPAGAIFGKPPPPAQNLDPPSHR